jgi:CRP-like cAMP-binding protein
MAWPGVIESYRPFLPVTPDTPVVTLLEGGTPLLEAPRLSARVGARVLLKLARMHEQEGRANSPMPTMSHETLAEMVGTTRSRITHFMNKFRNMGLIEYKGQLTVRTQLLADAVLCE